MTNWNGTAMGPNWAVFLLPYIEQGNLMGAGSAGMWLSSGGTNTTWGARRAKDGHPAPFKLRYVEIGNEDFFDREKGSYDGRFTAFYDAIKARYPDLQIIESAGFNAASVSTTLNSSSKLTPSCSARARCASKTQSGNLLILTASAALTLSY